MSDRNKWKDKDDDHREYLRHYIFERQFIPGPFYYQNIPSVSGFSLHQRISAPSQSTLHGDSEDKNRHRPQLSIVKQTSSEL